jgi:tRNA pseudouridine55 synthase
LNIDGVLVIDKPAGPTSHDVVAAIRRALGVDRVGHTGTLDPLATGVLPLVVGRATRLAAFMSGDDKEYEARIRFGATSATYDAEQAGAPVASAAVPRDGDEVRALLQRFLGSSLQMPPPYSAKKVGGTPAYKLARRNAPVEIKAVPVTVRELELSSYADGAAEVRIVCSSGFYVRSLAHDLGAAAGCGGYLEALRRTRAGAFAIADAVPLGAVVEQGAAAASKVLPMERLLPELPGAILSESGLRRASHGNTLSAGDFQLSPGGAAPDAGSPVRLFDAAGRLIGIADALAGGLLHPRVVLV